MIAAKQSISYWQHRCRLIYDSSRAYDLSDILFPFGLPLVGKLIDAESHGARNGSLKTVELGEHLRYARFILETKPFILNS